jgi:hypothetical protein
MNHPNQPFTNEEIIERVWGFYSEGLETYYLGMQNNPNWHPVMLNEDGSVACEKPFFLADEAVGVEPFEIIEGLPAPDEDDPAFCFCHCGESPASLGGPIHFRNNDTVNANGLVKPSGLFARLLAECRIDNQHRCVAFVSRLSSMISWIGIPSRSTL